MDRPAIESLWREFCEQASISPDTPYEAWAFGDSPAMADHLASLVKEGIKTGTCSALDLYEPGEDLPQVGEYSVILDGKGHPQCIIQTSKVQVQAYDSLGEDWVRKEGEGDLSYACWKEAHDAFFQPYFTQAGIAFGPSILLVCEEFVRVF